MPRSLGSGIAVAQAAEFALVPVVAGDRELQRANGLVETARALGLTVGPVCGSVLVALGGTAAAMAVDAVSFARRRSRRALARGDARTARRTLRVSGVAPATGLAFLLGDRAASALMVVVVFVSLLFMSASIPADLVYVEDVLGDP